MKRTMAHQGLPLVMLPDRHPVWEEDVRRWAPGERVRMIGMGLLLTAVLVLVFFALAFAGPVQ